MSNKIVAKGLDERTTYFQYRKSEGDKRVKLYISGKKISRVASDNANIVKFKWDKIIYAGWYAAKLIIYRKGESEPIKYSLKIDVLTKFDDKDGGNGDNFHFMMNELREISINPYRLFSPSRISEGKENFRPPVPIEQFIHILENDIIRKLEYVTKQIFLNPYGEYIAEMKYDVVDVIDNDVVNDMLNGKDDLVDIRNVSMRQEMRDIFIGNDVTHVSGNVRIPRTIITYDIYENQLLKNFLTRIIHCIKEAEFILENMKNEYKEQMSLIRRYDHYDEYSKLTTKNGQIKINDKLMTICDECRKRVESMIANPFFDSIHDTHDISVCTDVLLKDVNYNRFYRIFRNFMRMPKFYFSDNLGLTILDLPTVYEYWSLVYIMKSFKKKLPKDWEPGKIKMIRNFRYGYLFMFPCGKLLEFYNEKLKTKITIFYRESYRALLSEEITRETNGRSDLVPDIGIDTVIDKELCYIDILDPKYRTKLTSGDPNNPENARSKMAAYKMLIMGHTSRSTTGDKYDIVRNSIALYLGKSHIDPKKQIGGMRLCPRGNDTDTEDLDKLVQSIIDTASNHRVDIVQPEKSVIRLIPEDGEDVDEDMFIDRITDRKIRSFSLRGDTRDITDKSGEAKYFLFRVLEVVAKNNNDFSSRVLKEMSNDFSLVKDSNDANIKNTNVSVVYAINNPAKMKIISKVFKMFDYQREELEINLM